MNAPNAFPEANVWTALALEARQALLNLVGMAVGHLPAFIIAIVVLIATNYLARSVRRSSDVIVRRFFQSPSLHILFSKAAELGTWVIGVLIASLVLFPGLRLGDVVATLGIGSVAVGFAFQDIFKNFLAGVLLLIQEPFRIGDSVIVGDHEGVVEHIDIRTTNLRTYNGERVLVPNAVVFTTVVQVRTAYAHRRTDLEIGLGYDTDLKAALGVAESTICATEGVEQEPPPLISITGFGESSISFVVRYWTRSDTATSSRVQTNAVVALKAAFDAAGIEIPFPIRTLYAPQGLGPREPALDR
jgi:small conductance mechanosensitive channel